jgi:anthranilate synthase component 1
MKFTKIYSDLETPISVFLKIAYNQEYSFLLESAEHQASFGRYSFIGIGKKEEFILDNSGQVVVSGVDEYRKKGGLDVILQALKKYKLHSIMPELPPFLGGAVGYVSYDYVDLIEDVKSRAGSSPKFHFLIPQHLVVFDHAKSNILIIGPQSQDLAKKIREPVHNYINKQLKTESPKSNFSQEDFIKAVNKAKKHIVDGDVFQLVLSQKFSFRSQLSPFSVYRALRMVNPSPYMFYLRFKQKTVLGSSPEMLVKLNNNRAFLRPIAGTRRRGKDLAEDTKLEKELLNDQKEKAEHLMLLDLGRNDIGRVCKRGSVKVDEKMIVEKYSHVMHLVSQVSGELAEDKDGVDLLEAAFPAGTVTGAPKIKAMELINKLEPESRGPYAGAVVYFSFPDDDGRINLDSGIMIRSFFFDGDQVSLQAGAGIVYDSQPELEYKETLNKLKSLFRSLDIAKNIERGSYEKDIDNR